ncbi:hypothetical protein GCM10009820_20850 [Leifsonia soli]
MRPRMAWVEKPVITASNARVEVKRAEPRNSMAAGGTRVRRGVAMLTDYGAGAFAARLVATESATRSAQPPSMRMRLSAKL